MIRTSIMVCAAIASLSASFGLWNLAAALGIWMVAWIGDAILDAIKDASK